MGGHVLRTSLRLTTVLTERVAFGQQNRCLCHLDTGNFLSEPDAGPPLDESVAECRPKGLDAAASPPRCEAELTLTRVGHVERVRHPTDLDGDTAESSMPLDGEKYLYQ